MTSNRVIVVLVVLTVSVQAYHAFNGRRPAPLSAILGKTAEPDNARRTGKLDLEQLHVKGSKNAEVALVEFSDYECPFCRQHALIVAPQIEREFVDTGHLRYAFSHNPLRIHPLAPFLASAALCGGKQGRYWDLHNAIFKEQPQSRDRVRSLAGTLGLEPSAFWQCVTESPEPANQIARDVAVAESFRLKSTPSFGIGRVDANGIVDIQTFLIGVQPIEVFRKTINALLPAKPQIPAS